MKSVLLAAVWLAALGALAAGSSVAQALAGVAAIAAPLLILRDRRALFLAVAALGVLMLAWVRWQHAAAPAPADSVAWWADGAQRTLEGRIVAPPEGRGSVQRLRITDLSLRAGDETIPLSGSVQARVAISLHLRAGDLVRLDGRLERPPQLDDFDYAAYLARRDIWAVLEFPRLRVTGHQPPPRFERWRNAARARVHDTLWDALPATTAAVADGILTGQRDGIPRDTYDEFARAGVAHLLVISGFNIALVAGMTLTSAGALFGRRRGALLALLLVWVYAGFAGLSPPVLRAAVMGSLAVLATRTGRPYGAGAALLLAAAAMTAHDPALLLDVSFQLTFAACVGMLTPAGPLVDWARRRLGTAAPEGPGLRSLAFAAWETLAVTAGATLLTLPILLLNFERLSPATPITNLLLVPLFPLIMLTGIGGVLVALLLPAAAVPALLPVRGLLDFALWVTATGADAPGSRTAITWFQPWHAVAVYLLLGTLLLTRIPGRRRPPLALHPPVPLTAARAPWLALTPAALLVMVAAVLWLQRPHADADTHVTVFNLPGAPATLVTMPGGARILIDTGLAPDAARVALDRATGSAAPHLHAIIITRDAPSAIAGLEAVLDRYRTAALFVPPESLEANWTDLAHERSVAVHPLDPDLRLAAGEATLHVAPVKGERGRWHAALAHGPRRLTLTGQDAATADAGLLRESRSTALYIRMDTGRLRLPLSPGSHATLSTDGSRIRLHGNRDQTALYERTSPEQDTARR